MDELSMADADFARITAALLAKQIRVTINELPLVAPSHDHAVVDVASEDRLARHQLGVRGVWVHDIKNLSSSESLEQLSADPDQVKALIAAGAVWVGPRHLGPR